MNRNVLIFGGAAAVLVVAAIAFVVASGGGGNDPTPAAETPAIAANDRPAVAQPTPPGPATPAATDADALARFNAWADPLRAAGLAVAGETATTDGTATVVAGLSIAGPPDAIAWQLVMSSARIEPDAEARTTLRPTGEATLDVTVAGVTTHRTITTSGMRIDTERDATGRATSLVVRARDLTAAGGDAPLTFADGELRLALAAGEELVPARSTATIAVTGLVLPGQAGGPLGTTINALTAEITFDRGFGGWAIATALDAWRLPEPGLTISNVQFVWGALDLAGNGHLTLDAEGRPTGTFEVEVADPLMVLDAFHAVLRFDRDLLADVYAALLEELGRDPAATRLPFTVAIAEGNIILVGADRGIPDVVLGTVGPLFTPAGP